MASAQRTDPTFPQHTDYRALKVSHFSTLGVLAAAKVFPYYEKRNYESTVRLRFLDDKPH
jgi:hypothetical protein